MCGRFSLTTDPNQLRKAFPWLNIPEGPTPRYNVAPSQPVAVVPNDGKDQLDFYLWGIIPSWAKDAKIGYRMINARSETLAQKPSFRAAFRRRRCLIPADGFYEWKKNPDGKTKTPIYITLKPGKPFAFAGLWENWQSPDGSLIRSCTIITTQPNQFMSEIHNRMPVILPEETYRLWLDPGEPELALLQDVLQPYSGTDLSAYPVSRVVNSPSNDNPACIEPLHQ